MENKVKQKISANKAALGGWCLTGSVVAAEILAAAGFDWVCIDAEHSAINSENIQNLISVIASKGAEPFVRIALNDEIECKKALDAGASGIIVPMVKSYQDVERAVAFVKYPPEGKRSFALCRATDYGINAERYFAKANQWTFLAIMIEHIDAVRELDRIFANKYIDAILVGPYDLSGSMGIPGQFGNRDFQKVLTEIGEKARKHQVTMGMHEVHPTYENIQKHICAGYRLIGCGIDTLFIDEAARRLVKVGGKWTEA